MTERRRIGTLLLVGWQIGQKGDSNVYRIPPIPGRSPGFRSLRNKGTMASSCRASPPPSAAARREL